MATYAIGDVQGCYDQLRALLDKINYDPTADELWFAGDLVNRGPQSLETLQFIMSLNRTVVVLGNHDLHLLALSCDKDHYKKHHTLNTILEHEDKEEMLAWLRRQPLLHVDTEKNFALVHAGLPPEWSLDTALQCAQEVSTMLQSDNYPHYLLNMYGDKPDQWSDALSGWERLRYITNALTRIRFCDSDGRLMLTPKGTLQMHKELIPWFNFPGRKSQGTHIIFGHWAALRGQLDCEDVFAIDGGCVWHGELIALRLEDQRRFSVTNFKE